MAFSGVNTPGTVLNFRVSDHVPTLRSHCQVPVPYCGLAASRNWCEAGHFAYCIGWCFQGSLWCILTAWDFLGREGGGIGWQRDS